MKIRKKMLYGTICNVFFVILCMLLSFVSSEKIWMYGSFVLYVGALIFNILLYKYFFNTYIGFFSFFYLFAWILHLSQIYLGILNYETWDSVFYVVDFVIAKKAFTYSFCFLELLTSVYYIFVESKKELPSVLKKRIDNKSDIFFIHLFFYLFYGYKVLLKLQQIIAAKNGNYLDTLALNGSLQVILCTCAEVLSIFYLKYCCNKKKRMVWLIFILSFEMIFMFTGSRLYSVIYIMCLALFLSADFETKKSKWKRNVFITIVLVILVSVVIGVRNSRNSGFVSADSILTYVLSNNVFDSIAREFGFTQIDLAIAMKYQHELTYLLGSSYFNAIFTIFPNIGGFMSNMIRNFYFIYPLQEVYFLNYGGSFIAETFMNFGYAGMLLFIPVGLFVAKIDGGIRHMHQLSFVKKIILVALVFRIFSWERGYFFGIIRIPIWLGIIYFIYSFFMNGKLKIKK